MLSERLGSNAVTSNAELKWNQQKMFPALVQGGIDVITRGGSRGKGQGHPDGCHGVILYVKKLKRAKQL